MLRGLGQRHIEQGGQPAATANLGPGPGGVVGPNLIGWNTEVSSVLRPDLSLLLRIWQIDEVNRIKAFGPRKLGRQFADVVRRRDDKHIRLVIGEPGEKMAEQARGDAAVSLAANATERFLKFIDH